jgi:hypothetical protein
MPRSNGCLKALIKWYLKKNAQKLVTPRPDKNRAVDLGHSTEGE